MKNTKITVSSAGSYGFTQPTNTQSAPKESVPARPSVESAFLPFLEANHKLVRRHSIDGNGGGYEGL